MTGLSSGDTHFDTQPPVCRFHVRQYLSLPWDRTLLGACSFFLCYWRRCCWVGLTAHKHSLRRLSSSFCVQYDLHTFPQLLLFRNGHLVSRFRGKRSPEALAAWFSLIMGKYENGCSDCVGCLMVM